MSDSLNELLDMAKELNSFGAISDETVSRIGDRVKAREFREKMQAPRKMNGEAIKQMRERLGLSQSMLALTVNMSVASVSKWERGEKIPNGAALRMLNTIDKKGIDIFTD